MKKGINYFCKEYYFQTQFGSSHCIICGRQPRSLIETIKGTFCNDCIKLIGIY